MNITIYSTATCAYCAMTKRWLDERSLAYNEVRVDTDQAAADKMIKLSGQMGVPFTTIEKDDGSLDGILGFDVGRLRQVLNVQ